MKIDLALLRCPRCEAGLVMRAPSGESPEVLLCSNAQCPFHTQEFMEIQGQPVLIDFESSILSRGDFVARSGQSYQPRDDSGKGLRTWLRRMLLGGNDCARRFATTSSEG